MAVDLKTKIWAAALIRRAEIGGAFAAVVRKGDGDAGACLVKIRRPNGTATLYRPMRNMAGQRIWLAKGPESEDNIDHAINTRIDTDPDLWVLEIEDPHGRHFLTEPIEFS